MFWAPWVTRGLSWNSAISQIVVARWCIPSVRHDSPMPAMVGNQRSIKTLPFSYRTWPHQNMNMFNLAWCGCGGGPCTVPALG